MNAQKCIKRLILNIDPPLWGKGNFQQRGRESMEFLWNYCKIMRYVNIVKTVNFIFFQNEFSNFVSNSFGFIKLFVLCTLQGVLEKYLHRCLMEIIFPLQSDETFVWETYLQTSGTPQFFRSSLVIFCFHYLIHRTPLKRNN